MNASPYRCRCFKLVRHGEPMEEVIEDVRPPAAGEVLVRILAAGVCHSDVMLYEGFVDTGTGRKIDLSRGVAAPRVLGHEIAGEVVAFGEGAEAAAQAQGVKIGDKVVVFPWIGCGNCFYCNADQEPLCSNPRNLGLQRDGGFSQYTMVPDAKYLVPAGNLPLEQAAPYACSGLTAFAALKKLAPFPTGEKLLIIGAGGVGLSGVRFARQILGVSPIVADIDQAKWPLAMDAGASQTIDPRDPDALKAIAKAGGVAGAVDFVGTGDSFAMGFNALRKGGKMVSVGLIGGATPITPAMLVFKSVTLMGSMVGTVGELRELIALANTGVLPPLPVRTMALDDANDVIARLHAGTFPGRAVLLPAG
ncbi:MAG TPA: alcohol dehydrogenase [Burkholderiaceae bacterium]|jgi:alcohol dehydrogenase/propanol-preferring alcohol dehydrogenase|nr:alcohol dehydrogenase [Burkholderiaceae bacterium]